MRLKQDGESGIPLSQAKKSDLQAAPAVFANSSADSENSSFLKFLDTVKKVRAGCPWDKVQTPLSLRSTFFEETCEAIDAITTEDSAHVKEELGDVLLNVIIIAYMFEQQGLFSIQETLDAITEKLIRRHPHVFKQSEGQSQVVDSADNPDAVLNQWERIKENVEGRKTESVLDSVPDNFPPILKAYKMFKKASKKGFDWNALSEVQEKFCEELAELRDALIDVDMEKKELSKKGIDAKPFTEGATSKVLDDAQLHVEEEYGDTLLSFINYGRWLGVDPSVALERANKKFSERFHHVEKRMKEQNIPFGSENRKKMSGFWDEAKTMSPMSK